MLVQVSALHGLQIGQVADDLMVVRVDAESGGLHLLTQAEERLILLALPLGDDHRALGLHLLGVKQAVDHAVGLQAQGQLDLVGRQRGEVSGPIQVGECIPVAPIARDQAIRHPRGKLRRALEEHMLHPMRDARDTGRLIA